LKISWYVAWEIFRFAQCLEWLLDQPSYLSTVMFLQRKSRRGLKLNRCPVYSIKAKNAYSYVSTFFCLHGMTIQRRVNSCYRSYWIVSHYLTSL